MGGDEEGLTAGVGVGAAEGGAEVGVADGEGAIEELL